jgi:hypothetical protein
MELFGDLDGYFEKGIVDEDFDEDEDDNEGTQ